MQRHKMQRDKLSSQLAREKRMMTRNQESSGSYWWRWLKDELLEWLVGWTIILGAAALMLCIYAVGSLFR